MDVRCTVIQSCTVWTRDVCLLGMCHLSVCWSDISLPCNQLHAGLWPQPSDGAALYHQGVLGQEQSYSVVFYLQHTSPLPVQLQLQGQQGVNYEEGLWAVAQRLCSG